MSLHLQAKSVVFCSLVLLSGAAFPFGACASPDLQIAHVEPAVTKTGPIGLMVMARKDVAEGEKLSVEDIELIPETALKQKERLCVRPGAVSYTSGLGL